jgi:uncharacterized protein
MNEIKEMTMVLGASPNFERYSWKAVVSLKKHGYQVVAVGNKVGEIEDTSIQTGMPNVANIETISLYLNAERQVDFYDYIFSLNPKRIIFNPGTENFELMQLCREKNIEPVVGCTLVMLSIGTF